MKTALWLTDLHLDFVDDETWNRFIAGCLRLDPDGIFLTGDIATSNDVSIWLSRLADALKRPIHFVLGNHDYYQSSIRKTEQAVDRLCKSRSDLLQRLDGQPVIRLTPGIGLVGCGGWGDGQAGDGSLSTLEPLDFEVISDLARRDKMPRFMILERLGGRAADALKPVLDQALAEFPHVIVLTHVPPFINAAWHLGRPSAADFAPHFVCVATGCVLLAAARRHRNKRITIFCGHTHSPGFHKAAANLEIHTGEADYGRPAISGLIRLEPGFSVGIPRPTDSL